MIDSHCHILPEIDDGSESLEMTIDMVNQAKSDGITHILATPHHYDGRYLNYASDIEQQVAIVQEELDRRGINVILFPSQEVRVHIDLLDHIKKGEILFADLNQTYLLLELPSDSIPIYFDQLLFDLRVNDIQPVIVHPERHEILMKNPSLLAEYIKRGCYGQLTAASYLGKFGEEVQHAAEQMLDQGLVHLIASDAHRPEGNQGYLMTEVLKKVEKKYGETTVFDLKQNAKSLINGDPLITDFHVEKKRQKRWRLF